jgi:ApbE superfamily uncharacterized protein (UPF0280 family)
VQTKLFWIGLVLAGAAAVLGVVSTNMSAGGIPADVHPMGAVAVGVAALAFLYASTCVPKR